MVPLHRVIDQARERLLAIEPDARGTHWRNASELLAIAEAAIPHSRALAQRHFDIAHQYITKAEADSGKAPSSDSSPTRS